ncbi:MAG: hypothetical protein ACYTGQ_00755, partial [Planctomycetota bacterium]
LGKGYWVQTPSPKFPLETHTCVPLYWRLPDWIRDRLHRRWQDKLPAYYEMLSHTTVLERQEMIELFPDGQMYDERVMGFEKSFVAYRPYTKPEPEEQPAAEITVGELTYPSAKAR